MMIGGVMVELGATNLERATGAAGPNARVDRGKKYKKWWSGWGGGSLR